MEPLGEGTFSFIGRSERENACGVAVATAAFAVGKRVPHAEYLVGAVATQARTDSTYGSLGLTLMKLGLPAAEVLPMLLHRDPEREYRQVAMMDWSGNVAVHTGTAMPPESHHVIGRDCVAAGNTLTSPKVVEAMVEAFSAEPESPLADRLLAGLEAGARMGGDRRGATSAALLVVAPEETRERMGRFIDLRVDDHKDPIGELARLLHGYRVWREQYQARLRGET